MPDTNVLPWLLPEALQAPLARTQRPRAKLRYVPAAQAAPGMGDVRGMRLVRPGDARRAWTPRIARWIRVPLAVASGTPRALWPALPDRSPATPRTRRMVVRAERPRGIGGLRGRDRDQDAPGMHTAEGSAVTSAQLAVALVLEEARREADQCAPATPPIAHAFPPGVAAEDGPDYVPVSGVVIDREYYARALRSGADRHLRHVVDGLDPADWLDPGSVQ